MKIVRDRAEARWLPSRHRFALFRLWAFARLKNAKAEPRPGLMLMVDADQSAVESYTASMWIALTTIAYVASEFAELLPLPIAIAVAVPIGIVAMQVPIYVMGVAILPAIQAIARTRLVVANFNSIFLIALHVVVASFYALERTWVRFVAWQFLAVIALNAFAAIIVFLLRGPIARLESEYGVTSSSAN